MTTEAPGRYRVLSALVFMSGALGLVYEVLWMRHFVIVFGATTLAAAATLSGFFLGMAAGSVAFGARARRWRRPLAAFGLLEIGVAVGALLVLPVLGLYRIWYPSLYCHLGSHPSTFAALKLLLALLAVALPTFCMGGTLPALAEMVASGRRLGRLYAINVAGATLGALSVPFLLLPHLGVRGAYTLAVCGSLGVGVTAVALGWRHVRPVEPETVDVTAGAPPGVLGLAALSGVVTLAVQSLWTRMFALVHENSIHSFVVIVVLFLVGLAAGAAGVRGDKRRLPAARMLALAWSAAGLLIVASPRLFFSLTDGLGYLAETGEGAFTRLLWLGALIVLPAAAALGMAVPLLIEMAGAARGRHVGRLLGVNTLGAIVGPLAVTFVLAPRLGLWWSLVSLGTVVALAGAWTGFARRGQAAVFAGVIGLAVLTAPGSLPAVRVRTSAGERLLSVREGSHGATAVLEDPQDRWITVNNSYVLGGAAEAGEERWQGHLPLFLHPAPRRVAFLGLGTGITAGAALVHPVEAIVAIEIVPEVVAAAATEFAEYNAGLMQDPRVSVVTEDARNYLAASPGGFDVIVGDLLVPWRPGEAALYSKEHFESVRRALAADGVFCQWLPLYQLSEEQTGVLVRTFTDVFPVTTVWRGNFLPAHATLALVGHLSTQPLDADRIDRRVAELGPLQASNPFLAHPAGFWLFAVGDADPRAPWLPEGRNTDDMPRIELLSPSIRGDGRPLGVAGPRLIALQERFAQTPAAGTPLAALGPTRLGWRETGAALARASLGGEEGVWSLLRTMPPELQRSLGVTRSRDASRAE